MAGILSDTTHAICEGELLQIGNRYRPITEAVYLEIIRKKTAILYAVACQLGGALGGLGEDACRRLHDFGMELGMAFQIVDDCLDYAGKEAVAGKSLGTDLRQGKVTLPLIHLRESLEGEEAAWLERVLRAPLDPEAEEKIHRLVERNGVLGESFARAESFVQGAKAILGELVGPASSGLQGQDHWDPLRESLELAADYVLRRQR
jgi:octaprenyl-diphosphate synthase